MTAQSFDENQDNPEETFLPKEPLDLPLPEKEIPSHIQNEGGEIKTLLAWRAPGRPFKRRRKEFFASILLIVTLLGIIAFLLNQYLLILVIFSLAFVAIALATTPPHDFHYRISTEGITIEDHFFLWQELYDFYFKRRYGTDVLHIRTEAFFPGELTLTLGDISKEHIKSVLLPYLPYREVIRKTFIDKSGDWLSRNFPLEKVEKAHS